MSCVVDPRSIIGPKDARVVSCRPCVDLVPGFSRDEKAIITAFTSVPDLLKEGWVLVWRPLPLDVRTDRGVG